MVRVRKNRPTACPKPLRRCAQVLDGGETCMGGINCIRMYSYTFYSYQRTLYEGQRHI